MFKEPCAVKFTFPGFSNNNALSKKSAGNAKSPSAPCSSLAFGSGAGNEPFVMSQRSPLPGCRSLSRHLKLSNFCVAFMPFPRSISLFFFLLKAVNRRLTMLSFERKIINQAIHVKLLQLESKI